MIFLSSGLDVFNKYILPFILVLGIAAILAFLLGYLAKVFAVKQNPKIDEVRQNLAGANCGACGYAGCDDFARALVDGKASVNDCRPTSAEGKSNIAAILGQAVEADDSVAVVKCGGGNACADKCDYQGFGDCATAELLAGGAKACPAGCMGRCTCSKHCAFGAIDVKEEDGVALVDPKLCTSCGVCIKNCPKKIITRIPCSAAVYCACSCHDRGKAVSDVCKFGCIGCGLCAKVCPHGAIVMTDNLPVFDYARCTACGKCAEKCVRKSIRFREQRKENR